MTRVGNEGFLDQDMLVGAQRLRGQVVMRVRRSREKDKVDIRVADQLRGVDQE